jgi:WD40 repeat protein
VVGVRGDNFLHFYDSESFKIAEKLNMNTTGDNHVSFTPMDIQYSQPTRFLAVSTDQNRTILLFRGCSGPIAALYGILSDEYSSPRTAFNHSGTVLYSTSQDNSLIAWELASQRILHRFESHTKLIVSYTLHATRC